MARSTSSTRITARNRTISTTIATRKTSARSGDDQAEPAGDLALDGERTAVVRQDPDVELLRCAAPRRTSPASTCDDRVLERLAPPVARDREHDEELAVDLPGRR